MGKDPHGKLAENHGVDQESRADAGWDCSSQWNPGTYCQDLGAELERRAVHREVLTHLPA